MPEVGHGVLHRVTRVGGDTCLQVGDGFAELVLDLRLGLAPMKSARSLEFRVWTSHAQGSHGRQEQEPTYAVGHETIRAWTNWLLPYPRTGGAPKSPIC
jgi:hypothetical protein